MRQQALLLIIAIAPFLISCSQGTGFVQTTYTNNSSQGMIYPTPTPIQVVPTPTPTGGVIKNVMPVTVGNCGTGTYVNEPCVSVTICTPGTTNCQTIPNILLDTGSYGLRVFKSAFTVPLTPVTDGAGRSLAECAKFVIGADWGPVQMADVVLAQEGAARVPVHVIDSTFPGLPSDCTNPDVSPATAGYNGILGVGNFTEDCGPTCVSSANNRVYFYCSGATCTGTTVPVAQQVSNPVSLMPTDNNGVILQMNALAANETNIAAGSLILGIGTQSNNTIAGVTVLPTDGNGYVHANFNGATLTTAFIDSGSNTLAFPGPAGLTACPSNSLAQGFFCPATPTSYSATVLGGVGTASAPITFQVGNANTILQSGAAVSNRLASSFPSAFDMGLPFFFGRSVHVGIEGKTSTLGTGPFQAF